MRKELVGVNPADDESRSDPMPANPPAGAVEAALERVLSSAAFGRSPGLRRFLEFVVRQSVAGEDDRIKEYTIGVEVFARGPRFDPRCDAIVRVEAYNCERSSVSTTAPRARRIP